MLSDDSTIDYMERVWSVMSSNHWMIGQCFTLLWTVESVKTLQVIERKYHISLGIKKFDW